MSSSGELTSLLNQGFNGLEGKVGEIINKFNAAVNHINDWRYLLGPAMIWIREGLDKIREGLDKVVALVRTAVQHHTPVVSLIVQGFNWVDHVQKPLTELKHTKSNNLYYWEGAARGAYDDKVTAQNDATDAVAGKANEISTWLVDIARMNVEFMAELGQMVANFLGGLVTAAIEAATVVEIPFAVDNLAGALGQLVTDALNRLIGIAKRFVEAISKVRDAKALMNDSKLSGGRWPQAVTG